MATALAPEVVTPVPKITGLRLPEKLERTFRIERASELPPITEGAAEYRVPIAISSEEPYARWWGIEILGHAEGEIVTTYLDLEMALLYGHDDDLECLIGRVENWKVEDGVLRAEAVFDGGDPNAVACYGKVQRGFLKCVSVGYGVSEWTITKQNMEGPNEYRATKWTPMEASFVAVPADPTVGVNRAADEATVLIPVKSSLNPPAALAARSVSVEPNTPAAAAAPQPVLVSRAEELAELASLTGRGNDLLGWIAGKQTVAEIREQIKTELRNAQKLVEPAPAGVTVGRDRALDKPFANFGEQLRSIKNAASGHIDGRLIELNRAAPTGLGESVGADGAWLIAPQFQEGITKIAFEGGEVLSRVNRIPVTGNQYHLNLVDETARTNGGRWGGVRGYWMGENDTPTKSKPKFRRVTLDVTKKYGVLAYVTEEQLEDAPATATVLEQAFGEELQFGAEQAIWEGNGAGQPLGFMNGPSLVTQAAEGGQTATTINATNVVKMWSRLLRSCRRNAVWFINQDAEPQLPLMSIANLPVFLPPGGLSESPYGRIFNRPVVPVEFASTLGAVGDIVLGDLSWYALGEKAQQSMKRSIHVRFEQGEEAFRMMYRMDGTPMLNAAITPLKGSNTQSAYVALAAR